MQTMTRLGLLAGLVSSVLWANSATATVLYDGALGTSPDAQLWLLYGSPFGTFYTSTTQTTLNTQAAGELIAAGFANHSSTFAGTPALVNGAFPTLDRTTGFDILVGGLQIVSGTHAGNNNRAGFDIIAIASDKRGIELSFHTEKIFAQRDNNDAASALFTAGESVNYDTSSAAHQYRLRMLGNTYTLSADGTDILTGSVRDYSPWVPTFGLPDVYELPNFLFLGDNTTSASGVTSFSSVEVAVPEPAALPLLSLVGLAILRRRR